MPFAPSSDDTADITRPGQRIVAFGAAASMVHPSTGHVATAQSFQLFDNVPEQKDI